MAGEKTEKATSKRKKDERDKGNVFLSQEVVTVFSLLASFYTVKTLAPHIFTTLKKTIEDCFALGATTDSLAIPDMLRLFGNGCILFATTALPLLCLCVLVAVVITMAQTKMLFSTKAFQFKADRLSPISGFKKMFSLRAAVDLVKAIAKIIVLLYILYGILKDLVVRLPRMMDMSVMQCMVQIGDVIMTIVTQVCMVFVFLAVVDYFYQWWQYEKNLRMSKQEIKDEYKQTEGDPQVKGKIKQMQQQRARTRMMQAVPEADVVIRNPTHFAVAIKYDAQKNSAPVVVAKGMDQLALRIVAVAEANDVTVIEDRPLARGLYEAVELEQQIPEEFYQPIAKVLAFVYNLKKQKNFEL